MSTPFRPSTGLTIYNPNTLAREDIIIQFVARQALFDRLVDDLRRAGESGGIQHHLIIGQRGMGKTTLLLRLRFAIEDNPELAKYWFPLSFPEEQYNITRLSDFWANCLDALSDTLDGQGRGSKALELDEIVRKLPKEEKYRAEIALKTLTDWAEQEGKGLVLLIDNVDLILERLSNEHWQLREVLSHNRRLVFIGAAPTPISATHTYQGAFYDFFKIHELRGLTLEETRAVLLKLAELRQAPQVAEIVESDPGRIKAMRVLTGGNTRVLVVLFQVLAQEKDSGNVISELEQVLDLHTPYYKAVFESLPTQAQQIVDAMCLNWDPVTAAELASSLRLETNKVSAQLDRLTKDGFIEKTETPVGDKQRYQIAERFFNIWYLMRSSRRLRRKLVWLVDFLKIIYASPELHDRAQRFLKAKPVSRHAEMAFVFAQSVEDPALRHALEYEGLRHLANDRVDYRSSFTSMLDFDGDDSALRSHAQRITELYAIRAGVLSAKISWSGCTAEDFWHRLGGSWALSLEEKKSIAEQLSTVSEQEVKTALEKAEQKQLRLSSMLGPERTQQLMDALCNGDMADLTDVEGADAAAIHLGAPCLRAIARVEKFRKNGGKCSANEISDIQQAISQDPECAYAHFGLGMVLTDDPDTRAEAESFLHRALAEVPTNPSIWNILGNLLTHFPDRLSESESAYRKAIELDPNYATVWRNLGILLSYRLKRYDDAEVAFRRAVESDPKYISAWKNLSALYFSLKRFEDAKKTFQKIIELDPNDAQAWNDLGALYSLGLKQFDKAENSFKKANELGPNLILPWINLGNLYSDELKRYKDAEAAYLKAVELDQSNAEVWNHLGVLYRKDLGEYEKAEAAYRKAIEVDQTLALSWGNLGELLSSRFNRYKEAEEAFLKASELDPNSAELMNNLGALYHYELRQFDKAETHYRKATELNPKFVLPIRNLGKLLTEHLNNYTEAETLFRKAIELEPGNASNWNNLGLLLGDNLERYEEAESVFRKSIELDPDDPRPWAVLGTLNANQFKRYDKAEAAYRKVIELNPEGAWGWYNLGDFLTNYLKRYEEGEKAYRKAIELDPKFASPWFNLGDLFANQLNRNDEAKVAYRHAIELDPDNADYANSFAWFLFLKGQDLQEAEALSRQAVTLSPDDAYIIHTLACILTRLEKWDEASVLGRNYIVKGDGEYHAKTWRDTVIFFEEVVKIGHAADAVKLLDEIGFEDRWRPLREALRAISEGTDAPLLRAAPEIRQPAEELIKQLLPDGVELVSSLKTPGGKRAKRKKS